MNENRKKIGEKFLKESFGAMISSGRYRFQKSIPYQITLHNDLVDFEIHREPSVDISLSSDDYNRLIDMLGFFNDSNFAAQIDFYYREIIEQLQDEKRLRDQNPTLQKAYDQYQMILAMLAKKR